MVTIVTRAGKGSPLTNTEVDANFTNLNTGKAAVGANTDITSVALTTGTISTAPSANTDIANKLYVDGIASGLNFHSACNYATIAALAANTYNNGSSGVGATLTAVAVGTLTIDGYTLVIGDVGKRLLIKNEVAGANNGVYTLTQAGTAVLPYILTRATDYDTSGSGTNEIDTGDFILVLSGSSLSNSSWVQQTPLPITVGTTAITFTQFAAPYVFTYPATGIANSTGSAWGTSYSTTGTGTTVVLATAPSIAGIASFTGTGAVLIPVGTTAQQPTGVAGYLRFNSSTTQFEGHNGTTWASVGGAAISNDTSTATSVYPLFASATSGTALTVYTSNAKLLYKPSTGELSATAHVSSNGININADSISSSYTIATGTNGFSVGPMTINSGVVLTVASGQRHVVI